MECPFELPLYSAEFTGAFDSSYCVRDPSGELICDNLLKVEADYIVQAINSHENLKEVIKAALRISDLWTLKEVETMFEDEAKALAIMKTGFEQALEAEKA